MIYYDTPQPVTLRCYHSESTKEIPLCANCSAIQELYDRKYKELTKQP